MSSKHFVLASSIVLALVVGGCAENNAAVGPARHASVGSHDGSALSPAALNEYRPAPIPIEDGSSYGARASNGSGAFRRGNVGVR